MSLSVSEIGRRIYLIRNTRVLLDSDLALLYGTDTRSLNRAVRRNHQRFPESFMFELSREEYENLMCQSGTSSLMQYGGRRKLPLVFTEYGVVMLSSVLRSPRAIEVNIMVVEAFVRLREAAEFNRDWMKKIDRLEKEYLRHDQQFKEVFEALRQLMRAGMARPQKRIRGLSRED